MRLQIVDRKSNYMRKVSIAILCICLILMILYISDLTDLNDATLIILLTFFLAAIISISVFKGQKVNGFINLSETMLEIVTNTGVSYDISELDFLNYKIHSFNDQRGIFTLFSLKGASGLGNYLEFGKPYHKLEFFLTSKESKERLVELIDHQKAQNCKITVKIDTIL